MSMNDPDPSDECEFGIDNCGNAPYYTQLPGHHWWPKNARPMEEPLENVNATADRPDYWVPYTNAYDEDGAEYWVCWDCAQQIIQHVIEELPV